MAGDGVLGTRAPQTFKLKISRHVRGHKLRIAPFQTEPCSDYVLGVFPGPPGLETVGCVYDVKFPRRGEKESDPSHQDHTLIVILMFE